MTFPSFVCLSIHPSSVHHNFNVLLKQPLLVLLRSNLSFPFRRTLTSYQKVGVGLARMTRIPEIPVPGRFLRSNISISSNSFQRNLSKSILTDWPCWHYQIGKLQSVIGILFTLSIFLFIYIIHRFLLIFPHLAFQRQLFYIIAIF